MELYLHGAHWQAIGFQGGWKKQAHTFGNMLIRSLAKSTMGRLGPLSCLHGKYEDSAISQFA